MSDLNQNWISLGMASLNDLILNFATFLSFAVCYKYTTSRRDLTRNLLECKGVYILELHTKFLFVVMNMYTYTAILVAARCKAWEGRRSLTGIVGLNPAGVNICLL
jgi:hypothetical protein